MTATREMDAPTVALHTLGCRLNQYETEAIREQFVSRGFRVVPFTEPADVYVVNTCTVTNQADARARQSLRQAVRRRPGATVVATGCYAQTHPGELLDIEGVDLVLGNVEKGDLVDRVLRERGRPHPVSSVTRRAEMTRFDERLDVSTFENRTRAMLKIQDGCDQFCSFCIIPWARGRHRSLPPEAVLRQARSLIDRGYAEIVLTGVHLGEYGTDLSVPVPLKTVVRQLLEQTALPRLRLSSIWPTAVDTDLIDLFRAHAPRLCRYLHLAVQHGDDGLLKAMRRTYTAGQAGDVVGRLVDAVPDICIGADVMVGFPGETDASFQRMYDWLDRLPFAYFHVFTYSKRDHTRAARMPDQVPATVARERSRLLRTLSDRKSAAYNSRFRGRVLPVLVEEESDGPQVPRGDGPHGPHGASGPEGDGPQVPCSSGDVGPTVPDERTVPVGRIMTGRTDHGLRMWFEGGVSQAAEEGDAVQTADASQTADAVQTADVSQPALSSQASQAARAAQSAQASQAARAVQAVRMNTFVEVEVVSTDAEGAAGRLYEPAATP